MEIKKEYLQNYLHEIAVKQISDEYKSKGYNINLEETIGKYQADIVAKKDDETIVIEIKTGKISQERKNAIKEIGNYVRNQGKYKFLVVFPTLPKERRIEIDNIETLLLIIMQEHFPDELDELSTHTRLDEITEVEIDEISFEDNSIFIKGEGVVSVEIQMGSDGDQDRDDGLMSSDSFSFIFEVSMAYNENKKLTITSLDKLEIDTSSYYE